MDFLKLNKRISFTYAGKEFDKLPLNIEQFEKGNELTTIYSLSDGLKITNFAKKYDDYGAYEWVNYFENNGTDNTDILSEIWDCFCELPLEHEEPKIGVNLANPDLATKIYAPDGSTWDEYEFHSNIHHLHNNYYTNHIYVNRPKSYSTSGGRSSEKNAPFFNIHKNGKGYVLAIGWTGQWKCDMSRNPDSIAIKAKIEDTEFYMKPGEKFRTCSIVIMPYEGTFDDGQNKWRKFLRTHFSILGKNGKDTYGPLSLSNWGGTESEKIIENVKNAAELNIPLEYIWIDAGWYGGSSEPNREGVNNNWSMFTGDWVASPIIHKNGLKDVSKAIHEAGYKFILWFEPERAVEGTPITKEHPEYFLKLNDECKHLLLNLGDQQAWNYIYNTISNFIDDLNVDFYRQDFNISPLGFWRNNDEVNRKGILEIKHINGLYKFWDALLERFPNLIIDNCASGGRRIDIETIKRSIPLWRSDNACPGNFRIEGVQNHHICFNTWIPCSGTGSGGHFDEYRVRSAYSGAMCIHFNFQNKLTDDEIKFINKHINEYLYVRPFFYEDMYKLTEITGNPDTWSAVQFNRQTEKDGIIQIFRRAESPYETASLPVKKFDDSKDYLFTDLDDNSQFKLNGKEITENGFTITVSQKRKAKIFYYKEI